MSTLVGDVIQQSRDLMQDPPQTLPVPTAANATGLTVAGGQLVAAQPYYVVVTVFTPWGETIASNEVTVTLTGGQNALQVLWNLPGSGQGATKFRVYIGLAPGAENAYTEYPALINLPVVSSFLNTGYPPPTNSAYLPDTDGNYVRASVIFRWLNDALRQSSRLAGGLPDYSGFPSVINFATYVVTGEWVKMLNAWYDGYPVAFAPTNSFFKRNIVTSSILAGWQLSYYNNQLGVELWPQPARTAAQTTLASPMLATDTVAQLTSIAGFLLPTYGMVQIGNEICAYNGISGNNLIGLIRGLGGTVPTPWASATQVNELNAFFQGRRVFNTQYIPGQSLLNLPIPAGWDGTLIHYLMSKFYVTERDSQSAQSEMQAFEKACQSYLRMNRQITGPIQAGSRDYQFVVFGGTRFGSNVIP